MSGARTKEQLSAGALAMGVHLLFFAAMVFGLSWTTLPETPVYADLWSALPAPPPPPPPPAPQVEPEPFPPVPVEPTQEAAPEADITLKQKEAEEGRKKEAELRLEEEKRRKAEAKQKRLEEVQRQREAETRRKLDEELALLEKERLVQEEKQLKQRREQERKAAESKRLAQEKLRKEMERLFDQQAAEDMEAEREQLARVTNAARAKVIDDYRSRIRMKIQGLLLVPPGIKGNPEVVYRVQLLPNGEVFRVTLVKSSGQPLYDQRVEQAIIKASPLPLPPDKADAAAFREALELRFRPLDDDGGGRG